MEGSSAKKIVVMGGGSTLFAPSLVMSFIREPSLRGSTIALVDIDEKKLDGVYKLGRRMLDITGADYTLERTTDRLEALPGADFVVTSVEVDRFATWENDRAIPKQFGIEQALGENGGPGGLFHAMRQIPIVVDICHDIEKLCPNAMVLNLSNPMSRILQAVHMYTKVRFLGLCHEIVDGGDLVSKLLEIPEEKLHIVAAGLNHFTWFLKITHAETGEDLYPRVKKEFLDNILIDRLLIADLLRLTGYLSVTSDSHVGEYLPGGHIFSTSLRPDFDPLPFFEYYKIYVKGMEEKMESLISGQYPVEEFIKEGPPEILGEILLDVISQLVQGATKRFPALNLPNEGYISNLPPHCVVEVPAWVEQGKIRGEPVGSLPHLIAGWCNLQASIQFLNAKAAVEGDRQSALEALLLDPVVPDRYTAEKCLDAMLEANRRYLPRFFK
ncbi:MAG: alpha-glucosidase/alpha-galactosidase [Candidatus Abyssubacteria bacterium]